jgi:uncharacterized phage infection (PIP) family protein YhgE
LNQTPQGSPKYIPVPNSDDSSMGTPNPIFNKIFGKKSPKRSPKRSPKKSPKKSPKRSPVVVGRRTQTFRRKNKLLIDKPEYLRLSPSVAEIRDKLMSLAQVASRTRENSEKINEYTEKIRRMLNDLNPYFLFIQQYIAGRGEIQRELNAAVEDRSKLIGERDRLVGDLAEKAQENANNKIQEVAEGQIGILNDQIAELSKRIDELTAQLEAATRTNQIYENILRDIPADIDKMRGFIDSEDATLAENIVALDQVLSNFSNQLKQRLRDTLPQDQHAAFDAAKGGGRGGGFRTSRKYNKRKMTKRQRKMTKRQRKMTRKYRKSRKYRN